MKPHPPSNNLPEVTTRNRTARAVLDTLAAERPGAIWQYLTDALADTPALVVEIARLRAVIAEERLDRANLAAAALATISAHRDHEPDPLSYLRDELAAQGHHLHQPERT
jgi:hypothetical protein